jgi:hypothetical protein
LRRAGSIVGTDSINNPVVVSFVTVFFPHATAMSASVKMPTLVQLGVGYIAIRHTYLIGHNRILPSQNSPRAFIGANYRRKPEPFWGAPWHLSVGGRIGKVCEAESVIAVLHFNFVGEVTHKLFECIRIDVDFLIPDFRCFLL